MFYTKLCVCVCVTEPYPYASVCGEDGHYLAKQLFSTKIKNM